MYRYANPTTTTIIFQPDIFTSFRSTDTLRLVFPGEVHRTHSHGFSTYSGNYLLLCISSQDEQDDYMQYPDLTLHLVHFVKDPPSIQVRQLTMPHSVESELSFFRIHSMAVDDHLGVVYLTHKDGCIFAVPFA
jgi:hypothetical protein